MHMDLLIAIQTPPPTPNKPVPKKIPPPPKIPETHAHLLTCTRCLCLIYSLLAWLWDLNFRVTLAIFGVLEICEIHDGLGVSRNVYFF